MDPSNSSTFLSSVKPKKPVDPNKALRIARAAAYPKELWYLVACVIFLATLIHVVSIFCNWRRVRNGTSVVDLTAPPEVHVENGSRKISNNKSSMRRLPLAAVNAARIIAFRWTIPLRSSLSVNLTETFIALGYLTALLTWTFINTGNVTSHKALDATYWANRAGTLAASQTTLIVALSGRNNIISLLTGISYEKINIIHRAVARSVLVLIWTHFWGRQQIGFTGDLSFEHTWLRGGVVAATAWTLLVFISWAPVRNRVYELFYYAHVTLVFIVLFAAFFHMQQVSQMGYYVLPAIAVWGTERLLRLVRVIVLNFPPLHRTSVSEDTLELLSSDAVRLTVRRRARLGLATWRPAQTMFVTVPEISHWPFESHPFTISSVADKNSNEREIVFIIRARDGFTGKLRDAAREAGTHNVTGDVGRSINVILDGPYGSPPNLSGYETVVLFAGGTGVTYCLPLFNDLIKRVRENKAVCRRIVFIWSVRVLDHTKWISSSLVQGLLEAPPHLQVDIRAHVTSLGTDDPRTTMALEKHTIYHRLDYMVQTPRSSTKASGRSSGSSSPPDEKASEHGSSVVTEQVMLRGVKVEKGRPNVKQILREEIESAPGGPMSVEVCGPHSLSETVRAALRSDIAGPRAVLNGRPSVTLHVEKFGMS